ncbi:hypothetical protein GMA3_56 [Gordonia phage GMA3]|uniref:Exonuclease domain-containing protein n=1 Tax=Gordonia phage GMA3 TaxID=1647284 RepID=A0A0K0NKY1_9CAUD|nr:hypothetical protein AU105_gp056 [Gordonia phage GMA3]AKL88233.1 hypothetical protein GMA3_56 [Gordonia phage GMA3]
MSNQPAVIILDTETTGLDEKRNIILEVGIQIYNVHLELIDEISLIISDQLAHNHIAWLEGPGGDDFVRNMHTKNGLIADIRAVSPATGRTMREAELELIDWLQKHGLGKNRILKPLTGSSIHFDRKFISAQMPELNEQFHYRNIDISSIKELCKIYAPELMEKSYANWNGEAAHRVLADCTASRNELEFYLENLILAPQQDDWTGSFA